MYLCSPKLMSKFTMHSQYHITVLLFTMMLGLFLSNAKAQSGNCSSSTNFYSVDLSSNTQAVWYHEDEQREPGAVCCGLSNPQRCTEFEVTLHPNAAAISFNIYNTQGNPMNGGFYQLNCGPQGDPKEPICISGSGPHTITYCKPGNARFDFEIRSVPGPGVSDDDTTRSGCSVQIGSVGMETSSIVWNSIFPGAYGAYNSFLDCTSGCDSVNVLPNATAPAFIDYQVCGTPLAGDCYPSTTYCDTIRVYILDPVVVSIIPDPAIYCSTEGGIMLNSIVSGGKPNYSYTWRDPNGTTIGNDTAIFVSDVGTYELEIGDLLSYKCPTVSETVEVMREYPVVVDAGPDQQICKYSPGELNIALSGSVTGLADVTWSSNFDGVFTSNTNLSTSYRPTPEEITSGKVILYLTHEGNGGCPPVTDSVTIQINDPLTVTIDAPSQLCFNEDTVITAIVEKDGNYRFTWNTGENTQSIEAGAGSYSLIVTNDVNECQGTASVVIPENPEMFLAVPAPIITCAATASVTAVASGGEGSGGYTYSWDNGLTGPTQTVGTGEYIVTATDANNCQIEDTVFVAAVSSTLEISINNPPVVCHGDSTTLTSATSGGFPPYSYSWNTGYPEDTLTTLRAPAGNYCVTVTDNFGCLYTDCITIEENDSLISSIDTPEDACFNGSRTFSVDVLGGKAPYSYLWNTGETSQSNSKQAGTYYVTVTDDNLCEVYDTITFGEADSIQLLFSEDSVNCNGAQDGAISATVIGGRAPYQYLWNIGATTPDIDNLSANTTYELTVTDSLDCSAQRATVLFEPNPIMVSMADQTPISCYGGNNGTATVSVSGGVPPYNYEWFDAEEERINQNDALATGLYAKQYKVMVSDKNGCLPLSQTVTLSEPPPIKLIADSIIDPTCGTDNGKIMTTFTGGTPNYSYSWSPNGGSGASIDNLAPGDYVVTVKDANNCELDIVTSIYAIPTPIIDSVIAIDINCNGNNNGELSIYSSSYYNNESYSIDNGLTFSKTSGYNTLAPDKYLIWIKDSLDCLVQDSVTILEPAPLSYTPNVKDSECELANGSVAAKNIQGGTAPYAVHWENDITHRDSLINLYSGEYSLVVSDNNDCELSDTLTVNDVPGFEGNVNWSAPQCNGYADGTASAIVPLDVNNYTYQWSANAGNQTEAIAEDLAAGHYALTITEIVSGCQSTLEFDITDPSIVEVSLLTSEDTVCVGDSVNLYAQAIGGSGGNYTFLWNNGIAASTQTIEPLNYDIYTVIAEDSIGCVSSPDTVSVWVHSNPQLQMASDKEICLGDSILISTDVQQGLPGYEYLWENGVRTAEQWVSPTQNTTYKISVRDACSSIAQDSILVQVNPLPKADFIADNFEGCPPILPVNFYNTTDTSNGMVGSVVWNFGNGLNNTSNIDSVTNVIYSQPFSSSLSSL